MINRVWINRVISNHKVRIKIHKNNRQISNRMIVNNSKQMSNRIMNKQTINKYNRMKINNCRIKKQTNNKI